MGPCDRCKSPEVGYRWFQYRNGQRNVEAFCIDCGRKLGIAPRLSPYTDRADANASPTCTLDALLLAAEEGVTLISDGRAVTFGPGDWTQASPRLKQLVRERQSLLASLLGDNRAETLPSREQRTAAAGRA
jgi:hypothetical protein